ncbi:hypothetical protein ABPG74_005402 [Tetrahymena malaccensis]
MLLCRTKLFIQRKKEDYQQNRLDSSKKYLAQSSTCNLQQKNDFFHQPLFQKQNYQKLNKFNNIPSDSELLQKMNTNQYEKMVHKDNYFVTTNRHSYKNLDFNATKQVIHNDKQKLVKIPQQSEPDIFKSIYQVDFYKQKNQKLKPQILQKKKEKVSFQDLREIEIQNELKLKESKSLKKINPSQQIEKSVYQQSYKQRSLSSSSISSDSEYGAVKNKKQISNISSTQQIKRPSKQRKSILINQKNQNIIEKTLYKNRY